MCRDQRLQPCEPTVINSRMVECCEINLSPTLLIKEKPRFGICVKVLQFGMVEINYLWSNTRVAFSHIY